MGMANGNPFFFDGFMHATTILITSPDFSLLMFLQMMGRRQACRSRGPMSRSLAMMANDSAASI
jgi:hypothetical protein